ncbi:MAG: DinB family protein [Mucilaginibacter sp.]
MITKPQPGEYGPLPANYIRLIGDEDVLTVLEQQRDTCYNLFHQMTEEQAEYRYAEGKWSIKEMLGHMIDTERIFAFRALCFSREQQELPGFDQDIYMFYSTYNSRSMQSVAEEFKTLRDANLFLFRSINQQQEVRTGIASGYEISVRAMVYATAGHERHHLNIFKERYEPGLFIPFVT